eukprot:tig00021012_g17022.t1
MLAPDRFAASSNIYHEATKRTFESKEHHGVFDSQKEIWTYKYSSSYNALVEACRRIPGAEIHLIPPEVFKQFQALEAKPRSRKSSSARRFSAEAVADMLQKLAKTLLDKLMPFQRAGIEDALQRNARCLIGDEMGLGKTVQAIAIAAVHRAVFGAAREGSRPHWPLLVVCPASLRFAWRTALLEWLPDLRGRDLQVVTESKDRIRENALVVITSYGLVRCRCRGAGGKNHECEGESLATDFVKAAFKFVICDESHYLKTPAPGKKKARPAPTRPSRDDASPQSQRSNAVMRLVEKAAHVLLLSGTPALSRPAELFAQLRALRPKLFTNQRKFERVHRPPQERYCDRRRNELNKLEAKGATNATELHALLASTVMIARPIRRLKKDVFTELELPKKTREQVLIRLPEGKRGVLDAVRRDLDAAGWSPAHAQGEQTASDDQRQLLMKLYTRVPPSPPLEIVSDRLCRETGLAKIESVQNYVKKLLVAGVKFLIFAYHRDVLDGIQRACEARPAPPRNI